MSIPCKFERSILSYERRKQVFAAALKRVNRELDRMHKLEA